MVVIGGAGPELLCDMGSLQDMDHVTLMRPITKWSVQVPETRRILEYMDAAFRVAQSNVPGPVFLEMPLDLLMNMSDDAELPATRPLPEPPRPTGDPRALAAASSILARRIAGFPRRDAASAGRPPARPSAGRPTPSPHPSS